MKTFGIMNGLLIIVVLLTSCGMGDADDYNSLSTLRVLSIQIDQPEVAPGATVNLTPYVSDLNGGGRALVYDVEACTDLASTVSRRPDCETASDRQVLATGVSLTGLTAPNYTSAAPSFAVTVPTTILDNRSVIEKENGLKYLVVYRIRASDGTTLTSTKQVVVSTRATKNTNPSLTSITVAGVPLSTYPAAMVAVKANYTAGSVENYTQISTNGAATVKTETMAVTWFVSAGTLKDSRTYDTAENEWTPVTPAPTTHNPMVIVVLRDTRGGESVLKVEL